MLNQCRSQLMGGVRYLTQRLNQRGEGMLGRLWVDLIERSLDVCSERCRCDEPTRERREFGRRGQACGGAAEQALQIGRALELGD